MPSDLPPDFNKKDEVGDALSHEKFQADLNTAAEARGDLFSDQKIDLSAFRFDGESDPLSAQNREKVVAHARSLRAGLDKKDSATANGPWKPYWDYCDVASKDPEKALGIAEQRPATSSLN